MTWLNCLFYIHAYIYVMHNYFSKLLRKKNDCKTEDKIRALNKNDWKVRFGKTVNWAAI